MELTYQGSFDYLASFIELSHPGTNKEFAEAELPLNEVWQAATSH